MGIFRAYDIRGIYPTELEEGISRSIGFTFASIFGGRIVVGSDVRMSSDSLKRSLIDGLCCGGCDVMDVGTVCTPMIPFAIKKLGCDYGIMVTASHNPPEYNGFKFFDSSGIPIGYEDGLDRLERELKQCDGRGDASSLEIIPAYEEFLSQHFERSDKVVVVDAGNSASYLYAKILRKFAKVVELFCEPDGSFPNHQPDPSKAENLRHLQQAVMDNDADAGFGFDGDGDRLGVVDENGKIVDSMKIFAMLIEDCMRKNPGKVVHDVLCSKFIDDVILSSGGIPVECRVGHTYISKKMVEVGAVLGGELSGHFYFHETGGIDDALFAALRVLSISGDSISSMVSKYRSPYISYHTRVYIPEEHKFGFVERIKKDFSSYRLNTIDGVKIIFDDGWAVIRPSNTEPKLSVAYEAENEEAFKKIGKIVEDILRQIPK